MSPHVAKYIILHFAGAQCPLLFPTSLQHSHMLPHNTVAVAAGFYQILPDATLIAFGESETLGLASRPQDAQIIQQLLTTEPSVPLVPLVP